MLRIPLILLLISTCIFSCVQESVIRTTLGIDTEDPISAKTKVDILNSLERRLHKLGFGEAVVEPGQDDHIIIVTALMDPDDNRVVSLYHHLFQSFALDLWQTKRVTDPEIDSVRSLITDIPGFTPFFELELGYYQREVIGIAQKEDSLESIKDTLQARLPHLPNLVLHWGQKPIDPHKNGSLAYPLYMIDTRGAQKAPLTEQYIRNTQLVDDLSGYAVGINFDWNETGTIIWSQITREAADDGNRAVAMVVNDRVVSVPRVSEPITNGNCMLSMGTTADEALEVMRMMVAGRLPYPLVILREQVIEE